MLTPIPPGYTAITPYLVIENLEAEIAFLTESLDAKLVHSMTAGPGGPVVHADVTVHGAHVMMGKASSPHKAAPAVIYVYVTDADAIFARAAGHPGVTIEQPITDQFYGDRSGAVKTANGISWWIASRTEDLTTEQIAERMRAARGK